MILSILWRSTTDIFTLEFMETCGDAPYLKCSQLLLVNLTSIYQLNSNLNKTILILSIPQPSSITIYRQARAVRLMVYDVLGREVVMLVNEKQQPGSKSVEFKATNLPSGVYFYRLNAGTISETKKLLLLR